ncbi:MAG TPA: SusC/RagA family TonB-linked outer membrane protein [Hanamia sp.]|nr:SusC/RagA family TonB-linked outer membrane protein [Hanamia sp.]
MILSVGYQNKNGTQSLKAKTWIIMKLTIALLLFFTFQVSAKSDAQKITIVKNNIHLSEVFRDIERQTGYLFFYDKALIKNTEPIDVSIKDATLEQALSTCLKGQQLTYTIVRNTIVIQEKKFFKEVVTSPVTHLPDNVIRGKITDGNGQPLPGVSINLKGTKVGTTSDAQGNYVINIPEGNGILVFTNIGFNSQEIEVSGRSTIDVKLLSAGAKSLNEIVVTALGIKREVKSLTYSVQSINGNKLDEAKDPNLINTLQGKVAGVTITRDATGPGGNAQVIIRGNRSLSGNSQPLYIIDGVPLGGNIGMLNPDNIESMTVLKGASAAALYGSQGQNGAIIITTKRAKAGKISVDYNGGLTFDRASILPELQYEYGQGDAGVYNAHSEHSWGPKAEGQMDTLWNGDVVPLRGQPARLKNFFRTANTIDNSITVSGGSDKMQAYFSYGNTEAQGIMRNNDYSRHNVDLKINSNISSKLTLLAKGTYIYEEVNNRVVPGEGGTYALPSIFRSPTSIPAAEMKKYSYIDASGNERQSYWKPGSSILLNPYWALNRVLYYQQRDRFLGLFSAKYDFTDWLNIQARGSIDKTFQNTNNKIYADNYFSLVGSDYHYGNSINQSTNVDVLISVDHGLAKNLHLTGNVGGAMQQGNYRSNNQAANGLNKANFFFMSNAKNPFITDIIGKNPLIFSLYATASIDYKKYLYLDVTARNDWSSALPESNQSYFYPSIGLSAIVSDMLELPSWVSYGKVRITFANSGFGGTEYLANNYYSVGAGGAIGTPTIQSLGTYKPELTHSFETGLDWQFFKSRLGFNLTYYNTRTVNQLLLIGTPSASLFNQKYINAGLITNSGIELVMNFTPIKGKNFSWDATINYSKNKNKVVRLIPSVKYVILRSDRETEIRAAVGGSYGDMYVKEWEKDSLGRHLVDVNGLPIISAGNTHYLGNYNPNYMLGFSNTFTFKRFSLSFLIDYRNGGYVIAGTQALLDADGHSKTSLKGRENGIVLDGYTKDGAKNTKNISAQSYFGVIGDRYPTGGLYAYSSTNMRLRELTFGYRFPLSKTHFLKDAKLSVVGRNLFFFQRSAPFDPEITEGSGAGGVEYGQLPPTRNYGLNLKLSF